MPPTVHREPAEDVVGPYDRDLSVVYPCPPAPFIVDFAEDGEAAVGCLGEIGYLVIVVLDEGNGTCGIARGVVVANGAIACKDNGGIFRVEPRQSVHDVLRRWLEAHVFHEPDRTQGAFVADNGVAAL